MARHSGRNTIWQQVQKCSISIRFDQHYHFQEKGREEVYMGDAGIHKRVATETLFTRGNAEKQHKGPSVKDWWKKLWRSHTIECSSVIKRNDMYLNSLAWKEHTVYCQVKEAVKQSLSFNPIYQNAIFKIWFVYICLGRPLKFRSSKCQAWFSLDDRMAGVLFVYLFYLEGGNFSSYLSGWHEFSATSL